MTHPPPPIRSGSGAEWLRPRRRPTPSSDPAAARSPTSPDCLPIAVVPVDLLNPHCPCALQPLVRPPPSPLPRSTAHARLARTLRLHASRAAPAATVLPLLLPLAHRARSREAAPEPPALSAPPPAPRTLAAARFASNPRAPRRPASLPLAPPRWPRLPVVR
nr:atherin-like [Aegilops tauschii subsp. strangulata]